MWAIALAVVAFATEGPPVIWMDKVEAVERGLNVAEGNYAVWVWAKENEPAVITVGGQTLTGTAKNEKESGYAWIHLGNAAVQPGKSNLVLGSTVASFALSLDPAFDPNKAPGDMRVLSVPEAVQDERALTAKYTDTVFTMPEFSTRDEWEALAWPLRRRILIATGLLPLPERTPLNAKVFDRVTHEDYTVEKVSFEARPGFLVTGNLYRPIGAGPFPGVLCPHGHWEHGRLEDTKMCSVPGRCITFARMGIVAFSYDMIGYNDSLQFPHGWGGEREKLWGLHPFAFQLWSSVRAVDFLQSLAEVDPERIGCTGASGGGTQTFALTAVDSRVKVSAPVNMISCSMQGGCLCENAPLLRMTNSNMEIGALMGPRPLLMVAATGDWTRETLRVEFPSIRSIYALYGKTDAIESIQIDEKHNYNQASREAVYRFFGKWLLGQPEKYAAFTEPPFTVEPAEALRVFPDGKLPEGLPTKETIIEQSIESTRAKWDAILPTDRVSSQTFRGTYGAVLSDVLGTTVPKANDLASERTGYEEREGYVVERWILRRCGAGDAVPAILYRARNAEVQDTVLIVHGDGKAALADVVHGGPGPLVKGLLDQGRAVMTIDAFMIGEHHSPFDRTVRKQVGRFMDTFQPTDTGYRVQDVLTAAAYLRSRRDLSGAVSLVGLGQGGMWCLMAGALDEAVKAVVVDANGFNSNDDRAWVDTYYVPSLRSVGDIATAAALMAPRPLRIFNTGDAFDVGAMERIYRGAGVAALEVSRDPLTPETITALLKG